MNEEKEIARSCFYYELFMERANGQYERNIPGYHAYVMKNLMIAEKGKNISVEIVAQFEEQLIEIKKHMEDAIDKYMAKPKVTRQLKNALQDCKDQVVWAVSSDELMGIVYKVIDLTVAIPIEMKSPGFEFS